MSAKEKVILRQIKEYLTDKKDSIRVENRFKNSDYEQGSLDGEEVLINTILRMLVNKPNE